MQSLLRSTPYLCLCCAWTLSVGQAVRAGTTPMTTELVTGGLSLPLGVTAPPGDYNRLFIIEQRSSTTGRIRIFDLTTNTLLATPFLSISPVATQDEQGLLGLAFHPDYATNGFFYINYTDSGGTTRVVRYQASPPSSNVANAGSASLVLAVAQPFANHNGGWMGFGPDGYLYIAMGDGGSANDPGGRAQDTTSQLLGKMLRLDVDGADAYPADANRNYALPADNPFVGITGDDEIWAYGLRNPWRSSFDRETGDFYIADVGQDVWEEVNFAPASSVGGENYGWRCMEGLHCTGLTGCTCNAPALTLPVHEYQHTLGCSVTGGYVYRGCAMPDMQGIYFFADYCSGRIWSFVMQGGLVTGFTERTAELDPAGTATINTITSFGEDARGELYICDRGGQVYRIVPAGAATPDCNGNAVGDGCDLLTGTSEDVDGNGIPDECQECVAAGDCDDGSACTADSCVNTACVHDAIVCNDEDSCTADSCSPATGCVFDPISCPGACCRPDQTCSVVEEEACVGFACDVAAHLPPTFVGCFGDVDGNGVVNAGDRGIVSANIGEIADVLVCVCDLDGNGVINPGDRGIVSANVGSCEALPDYQNGSGLNGGSPDTRFPQPTFLGSGVPCPAICP